MIGPPKKKAGAISAEDRDLWARAMRDAQPLAGRAITLPDPPPPPVGAAETPVGAPRPGVAPAGMAPPLAVDSSSGLDKRLDERLGRGTVPIDGRLDLHGLAYDAARQVLFSRLRSAHDAGKRCILVITGKGLRSAGAVGVLRQALPDWLNSSELRPLILAVRQAQPRHGGGGAFYVLLKRRRV